MSNIYENGKTNKIKVGIITMYNGSANYGGILQAYALTYKMNQLGFDCEQICCRGHLKKENNDVRFHSRIDAIQNFKFNKIRHSKSFYKINDIRRCLLDYDVFICGSDQIWNTTRRWSPYYLAFVPDNKLKIAYSASFGRSVLSIAEVELISYWLKRLDRISVREIDGQKILNNQFSLSSEVTLDPTLLLDVQEWDKIAEEKLIAKPYVFVYLLGNDIEQRRLIKKYAKDLELIIVFIPHTPLKFREEDEGFADIEVSNAGIETFVSLIKYADMIITDSFHGCIFSIIYRKRFWAFKRHKDTSKSSMNSRIYSLFESLNMESRLLDEARRINIEELNSEIDYDKVEISLIKMQKKSVEFLNDIEKIYFEKISSINAENMHTEIQVDDIVNKTAIELKLQEKKSCTGCHACFNICTAGCISMLVDDEGFWYPKVDKDLCIGCEKCIAVCPMLNKLNIVLNNTVAYACINKDEQIRLQSSSGGIFTLLAEQIIKSDGVVFGAGFNKDFYIEHSYVETSEGLEKFRGSKYVQSKIGDTYNEVKMFLDEGRKVLFSGTPCQIGGLKSFLNYIEYNNLICVDLVCHGVPSPAVWNKYLEYQKNLHSDTLQNISFRDKSDGWRNFFMSMSFKNNLNYNQTHKKDLFMQVFLKNICLRPSCYDCRFKGLSRNSDITLADFWGVRNFVPEMDDNKGISLIFVNSDAGKTMIEDIKNKILYKELNAEETIKSNRTAVKSVAFNLNRSSFFKELDKKPFRILVKEYLDL